MFLKNYTSEATVQQTIAKIEAVLIRCKVSGITKEYDPKGEVCAVRFHIPTATGERTIRLPADVERAQEALWTDYQERVETSYRKRRRGDFLQQAQRTAWKLMQDWIEVQMSMIELKQAETEEVFLPYIWDARSGNTVYQQLKSNNYRGLLAEANS